MLEKRHNLFLFSFFMFVFRTVFKLCLGIISSMGNEKKKRIGEKIVYLFVYFYCNQMTITLCVISVFS